MLTRRRSYLYFFISCLTVLFGSKAHAQYGANDTIVVPVIVYKGETLIYRELEPVDIPLKLSRAQRKKYREWTRLRNAVYVTYPYAQKAGVVFNDIESHLAQIPDKKKRHAYIKTREKELKEEFTKPLTNLSVYQGKVLMKLINRETGNSCYNIIHEYKGSFSAGFWQSVAWVFGSSLKQTYDAQQEDAEIENFVQEVKSMYGI